MANLAKSSLIPSVERVQHTNIEPGTYTACVNEARELPQEESRTGTARPLRNDQPSPWPPIFHDRTTELCRTTLALDRYRHSQVPPAQGKFIQAQGIQLAYTNRSGCSVCLPLILSQRDYLQIEEVAMLICIVRRHINRDILFG